MNELMDLTNGGMAGGAPGASPPSPDTPVLSDLSGMLRSGAAGRAMDIVKMRKSYNDYVLAMQSDGQAPLPFEEWLKQQSGDPMATGNPYRSR